MGNYCEMLLLLLLISLLALAGVRGQQLPSSGSSPTDPFFIEEPDNVTVIAGKNVLLKCLTGNSRGRKVQWTYDDFGLGNDRRLIDWTNLRMVGQDLESRFTNFFSYNFFLKTHCVYRVVLLDSIVLVTLMCSPRGGFFFMTLPESTWWGWVDFLFSSIK
jgi:hypothetical protein